MTAPGPDGTATYPPGRIGTGPFNAVHVPYRGSVELPTALLANQIQFAFPIAGTALPFVKAGKMRALAVSSAKRIVSLPDVPTLKEVYGDDLLVQEAWGGLWAPAGTPAPVVQQLFVATRKAFADPELRAAYQAGGTEPELSESPEAFGRFMKAETQKWTRLIQLTGVKAD